MEPQIAVDLGRQAIWMALLIGSPVLLAGMAVGLVIGLFQSLTQIQEQSVAMIGKIIIMVLAVAYLLSWMTIKMLDYSHELIAEIPSRLY
jgi:flagellar biosynthetic protein FliQ